MDESVSTETKRDNGHAGDPLDRRCRAKNRAGAPCRSPVVGDDGLCAVHSGRVDMREVGRLGGLASAEVRLERARHVRERLQQRVERHFEDVWAVFMRALNSDNEQVQLKAAMGLLAEAYGNPGTALIGDADKPVTFVLESAFAKAAEAAEGVPAICPPDNDNPPRGNRRISA
jgi:hypothetical protein